MFVELLLLVVAFIFLLTWLHRKPKNLPPGEWGLPIVGYLPFMNWKLTKTLTELRQKHGKMFTIKIGSKVIVILSDYDLIKSTFQKLEFSGRPFLYNYNVIKKYFNNGVLHCDGKVWAVNRRFALRTLRDFGLGRAPILDEIIVNEAHSLVQDMKKNVNKPIEVDWNVNVSVLNVIWRLVADRRYDISDKEIQKFSKDVNDNFEDAEGAMALFVFFPWLVHIIPEFVQNKWMKRSLIGRRRDVIFSSLQEVINEHKEKLDPNNPKDMIDKYLIELKEQKDNPEYQHWGDIDLLINVYDFFIAGSETTSSTLRWFFLYMAKYPDVQKKVQKEIDEHVPKGQQLSLHDKEKLPLLEALGFEIHRFSTLTPLGFPHEVKEDSTVEGYNIPKGAWFIPDVMHCHRNAKYWKHPNEFCIDNFLDENGKPVRNKEGYLTFLIGRRACIGESLANMELFVFTGVILQNFEISEPDGQNASITPIDITNVFNMPANFKVILKPRY